MNIKKRFLIITIPLGFFLGGVSFFVSRQYGFAPPYYEGVLLGIVIATFIGVLLGVLSNRDPDGRLYAVRELLHQRR